MMPVHSMPLRTLDDLRMTLKTQADITVPVHPTTVCGCLLPSAFRNALGYHVCLLCGFWMQCRACGSLVHSTFACSSLVEYRFEPLMIYYPTTPAVLETKNDCSTTH